MSLFGGFFSGIGRGIGKIYGGVVKPLVTSVVGQYLGQGAGSLVQRALSTKSERAAMRGDSTDWRQILPSYATTLGADSIGFMQDPALGQAFQMMNPIKTQYQSSINTPPEPDYYNEEDEEEYPEDSESDYYEESY